MMTNTVKVFNTVIAKISLYDSLWVRPQTASSVITAPLWGKVSKPPEAMEALQEEIPLGVLGKPSDVAEAVAFLASEGANFITGQVMCPNGGMVL